MRSWKLLGLLLVGSATLPTPARSVLPRSGVQGAATAEADLETIRYLLREAARAPSLEQAQQMLQEAAAALRAEESESDAVEQTHAQLALTAARLGSSQLELRAREWIVARREKLHPPESGELLAALFALAQARTHCGDFYGADQLLERVYDVQVRRLAPDDAQLLATKQAYGSVRFWLGDIELAHELFAAVHAAYVQRLPPDATDVCQSKLNLAAAKRKLGEQAGAMPLLESVHEIYEKRYPQGHPEVMKVKHSLAMSQRALGNLEEARALFAYVTDVWKRQLPMHDVSLRIARQSLILTCALMGEVDELAPLVVEQLQSMKANLVQAMLHPPRVALEECDVSQGRLEQLMRFAVVHRQTWPAVFAFIETRRHVATSSVIIGAAARRAELDPLRNHWSARARELSERVVAGPASEQSLAAWSAEVAELATAVDRAQHEFFERGAREPSSVDSIEARELAAQLPRGSIAVGYLLHQSRPAAGSHAAGRKVRSYAAMVLESDATVHLVDLGRAERIEERIAAWRDAIGKPLEGESTRVSSESERRNAGVALRRAVLDPVLSAAESLEPGGPVFVCLDGALHLVPLDALPTEQGSPVGELYRVRREVSYARLVSRSRPSEAPPSLLALGDAAFDSKPGEDASSRAAEASVPSASERSAAFRQWERLHGTGREVGALEAAFKERFDAEPTVLRRADATKARLYEHAPGKRYVHIATHGWFAPEDVAALGDAGHSDPYTPSPTEKVIRVAPLTLSGLALAGANRGPDEDGRLAGVLTAEELAALDLSSCQLAVLSACETHLGPLRAGLGIRSLQVAVHAAGARTAVTSLWKVGDDATLELMRVFYAGLWERSLPPAEALWAAKRWMRERYPPAAWSGWVLTGDPE